MKNILKFETQLVSWFSMKLDSSYMKPSVSPCSTMKVLDLTTQMGKYKTSQAEPIT